MATALIVGIPLAALFASIVVLWGTGIHLRDLGIAVALYVLTGHGVTIGFHRLLAHKALTANHRRHHVLAPRVDPRRLFCGCARHALLGWAGLVRVALLHHVTWSVNSLCHMIVDARSRQATPVTICASSP